MLGLTEGDVGSLVARVHHKRPRIVVGIATTGRPAILTKTVEMLKRQGRQADRILVCPARADDVEQSIVETGAVTIVNGNPGLPAQRNAILAAAGKADIVVFFDDDFFPEDNFLEQVEAVFRQHPDVVMVTGEVVADGIMGPGYTVEEAQAYLDSLGARPVEAVRQVHNGYGCNMAMRMSAVRALDLRFDENLPLYGWLEDVDFSRRLAFSGRIVNSNQMRGVHLGNKGGRTSGVRLGYSQVINPLYMVRKGTIGRLWAARQIIRNLIANTMKSYRPEPWVDRKGRMEGNLLALRHAIQGKLDPKYILLIPNAPPKPASEAEPPKPVEPPAPAAVPEADRNPVAASS